MGIRAKIKAWVKRHRKLGYAVAFGIGLLGRIGLGFCADSGMTDVIQDWLPTIISFAMLGMVLGFMKKFSKG